MLRHLQIRRKVATSMLLTSIVVLIFALAVLFLYELRTYRVSTIANLETLARVTAANTTAALLYDDRKTAEELLSALRAEPDVTAVALYDRAGAVFATFPTNAPAQLWPANAAGLSARTTARTHEFAVPVAEGPRVLGTLYMKATLTQVFARLRVYALVLVLVLIGAIAVALLVSSLLQKGISEPILKLAATARYVSEHKDFSVRAQKISRDEIGQLTDAFNEMLHETHASQSALRESEQRFRSLADTAPVLIWVNDLEGCEFVNRAYLEYLGRPLEQVLSMQWTTAVHPDDLEGYLSAYQSAFQKGSLFNARFRFRRADGEFRWFQSAGVPRFTAEKTFIGYVGASVDVQDVVAAREVLARDHAQLEALVSERTSQLQEKIFELEAFSYSVSHDMRGPLRAMNAFSESILEDYRDKLDEEGVDMLNRIHKSSKRLDALIQDVLAYSRIAKTHVDFHPVALQPLIEEITEHYPDLKPPSALVDIRKPLPTVLGHETYLTQCLSNLLANAIKFVAPGVQPRITVRAEEQGDYVKIWVEDNGIGIDPSHFDRIFQIFGRVYSDKKYEGTGIGLAIVKKAVERMGGRIGVQSELGKGARFWIQLRRAT